MGKVLVFFFLKRIKLQRKREKLINHRVLYISMCINYDGTTEAINKGSYMYSHIQGVPE